MEKIIKRLNRSDSLLLATHTCPDGDAIGSLIAMGLALDKLNKRTVLYNESPIPAVYRFLPCVEKIRRDFESPDNFDTAVVLDCGCIDRIGGAAKQIGAIPDVINIDHHVTNSRFGNYHLIDTTACATAEIVYKLIKKMLVTFNRDMACSIYTAIFTDTGSFRFSNTNKSAFSICDEMVSLGVDPYYVAQHVYGTYSLGRIKLLNLALDSIEISCNGKLSMMTLTRDMLRATGTQSEDAEGLINYARRIEDVKVAVLIQEHDSNNGNGASRKYHVSLRSDGTVDVAAIASLYGGGGHFTAAGFNVATNMADLRNGILGLAEKM